MTQDHGLEYRLIINWEPNNSDDNFVNLIADFLKKFKSILQYWYLGDNSWCVQIVNTKNSDARLLNSEYYLEREETWFDEWDMKPTKLEDGVLELTNQEKEELTFINDYLESHNKKLVSSG